MMRSTILRVGLVAAMGSATLASAATGQPARHCRSPLSLADVVRIASERRDEIAAARARTLAAEQRPAIVSALEDPMISPSLDHLPFMWGGADVSVTIEQQIPLSGIRGHRRASALADVDRLRADVNRTRLDVGAQAANAFLMLQEQRRVAVLVDEQIGFARDVVQAANARYGGGTSPQADVLRAEVEVARLEAVAKALVGEVRSAEAMLNASLALDAESPVPELVPLTFPGADPRLDRHQDVTDDATGTGCRTGRDRPRGSRRRGDARHVPPDGDDPNRTCLHDDWRSRLDGDGGHQPADLAR